MATSILSRTIISVLDKKLILSNSGWAGTLNIGTDWTRIRIGLRWAMQDTGANLTGTPRLWIGLLSNPSAGLANGPLGGSTSHFVGGFTSLASWIRGTTPIIHYQPTNGTALAAVVKRVGATNTTATAPNFPMRFVSAEPGAVRVALVMDILKGSPNFTVACIAANATTNLATGDLPLEELKIALVNSLNADVATYLTSVTGVSHAVQSNSIAVNEGANGSLNAVCVAWNLGLGLPEFSEILFAKMA